MGAIVLCPAPGNGQQAPSAASGIIASGRAAPVVIDSVTVAVVTNGCYVEHAALDHLLADAERAADR